MASLTIRHVASVAHSLHSAASSRTSACLSRSTRLAASSVMDSIAKMSAAMRASLSAMAACLPMGAPHCMRSFAHAREISRQRFASPTHAAGSVNRPVSSVVSATRKPLPSASKIFSARHADVGEADDAVVKRLQAHEMAAVHHFHARPVHLDDERRDLILRFAVHHFRRRFRHDDNHARLRAVRAPEFFAVENEMFSVRRRLGVRGHRRRIGANVRFRERERRNFPARDARQVFLLLRLGAEQNQRLRHADGLMRRNQRRQIAAPTAEQHRRAAIIRLRQTKPAVFRRNFDSKRAEPREFVNHRLRNFARAVNFVGINFFAQQRFQLFEKRVALIAVFGALNRKWMHRRTN